MNNIDITHTHTQTYRHDMHRIMWCDERSIHSTAERGLSASLSLGRLGWLGMLADRPRDRLALAPPCAHASAEALVCLASQPTLPLDSAARWLTQPTVLACSTDSLHEPSRSAHLRPACLLAYACLCLLLLMALYHGSILWLYLLFYGSFLGSIDRLHGRMAETAPRGWKWLIRALWHRSLCACMRADCIEYR